MSCLAIDCNNVPMRRGYCKPHYLEGLESGEIPRKHIKDTSPKIKLPEYRAWRSMKSRCFNANHPAYSRYGGRGITVCSAWLGVYGYQAFLRDMGQRPSSNHSLDRIDNSGNYEPSNCRWATKHEQNTNTRANLAIPGVYKYKNRWLACLKVNKVMVLQKYCNTYEEATIARKEAEAKYLQ